MCIAPTVRDFYLRRRTPMHLAVVTTRVAARGLIQLRGLSWTLAWDDWAQFFEWYDGVLPLRIHVE